MVLKLDRKDKFERTLLYIKDAIKGTQWDGHVFAVGGCVRDKILGIPMHDIDLVIDVENGGITFAEWMTRDANCYSANSNPVVFPKYGTAKFNFRQNEDIRDVDVECVQTRKEQYKNSESRNPETIFGTIEDDAKRRDLTINALYLNLSTLEVIDPTNSGLKDIKECVIRTTNTPSIIFNEDPLRLLRVIRFATRLGWGIEKDTWFGIIENADRIDIVSKERVAEELSNILMCSKPSIGFNRLKSCGLLKILLPEVYEMIGLKQGVQHFGDVFEHTMSVIDKTGDNKLAKWAALLHDTGKVESLSYTNETPHFYGHEYISGGITKTVLSRLKFSNKDTEIVWAIVKNHMRLKQYKDEPPSKKVLRKFISEVGNDALPLALSVIHADNASHSLAYCAFNQIPKTIELLAEMAKTEDVKNKPKPPINGKDVMEHFGLKQGPRVGRIMKFAEQLMFENPDVTSEECLSRIEKAIDEGAL